MMVNVLNPVYKSVRFRFYQELKHMINYDVVAVRPASQMLVVNQLLKIKTQRAGSCKLGMRDMRHCQTMEEMCLLND